MPLNRNDNRVISLAIVYGSLAVSCSCGHISDTSLENNFRRHEATFEQLRDMFVSDSEFTMIRRNLIRAAGVTLRSPPNGVEDVKMSPKRYEQYLKLFDIIGLDEGVDRDGAVMWFVVERPSFFNGDVQKGYIFSASAPSPLVPHLDSYVPQPTADSSRPRFLVFKFLKAHWYLFKISG